jgi:hypothetical protein
MTFEKERVGGCTFEGIGLEELRGLFDGIGRRELRLEGREKGVEGEGDGGD